MSRLIFRVYLRSINVELSAVYIRWSDFCILTKYNKQIAYHTEMLECFNSEKWVYSSLEVALKLIIFLQVGIY